MCRAQKLCCVYDKNWQAGRRGEGKVGRAPNRGKRPKEKPTQLAD
jgi:hypothetical protein